MSAGSTTPPADWQEIAVQSLAAPNTHALATGPFGSAISSQFFRDSGVPVIRGGNLSADSAVRLSDADLVFLTPEKAAEFTRSTAKRGDLVFTCWGTINQVGYIDERSAHDAYVISNKQMKLTPDRTKADPEFLYYLFSGPQLQAEILRGAIGSSIPGFNLTRLKTLKLHIPVPEEQKRIADVLSTADAQIDAIERLIAKKEAIKQGLMQQLLTGETRLPGFDCDWTTTTLGAVGTFFKGRGVTRADLRLTGVPCVRYGELYTVFGDYIKTARSYIDKEVAANALPLQQGDLVFAGSGETREEIGKCAAYLGVVPAVAGGDTIVLRSRGCDPVYLSCLLNSAPFAQLKARAGQGDAVVHINSRALAALEVRLPPQEEQAAIARALTDADRELGALRRRLEKAKAIKEGLMQELLTGRTRLPVTEPLGAAA